MSISAEHALTGYINALRPLIYINHFDFHAVDELIKNVSEGIDIYEYNNAVGRCNFETKLQPSSSIGRPDLSTFLELFDGNEPRKAFVILKDVHYFLNDPAIAGRLKSIAERTMFSDDYYVTIFLVCSQFILPQELEKMTTVFDIPLPDVDGIENIIKDYVHDFKIPMDSDVLNDLKVKFRGLSEFEIRQILNLAYQQSGMIDEQSATLILKEKEQIIRKSGILELVNDDSSMEDIGGLAGLKYYLESKALIFKELGRATVFGVDMPKGILIVGFPGCGKTLSAKATAKLFDVPLLRLDIGKLMGKYVGESENNLRRAIKTAEAVAPCVLWIDEVEKAFSGIGGISGASDITTRLFGQFLTWMQEKKDAVYVVATSNDIAKLPPEFLRRGRFDELFLVDFPDKNERKEIFENLLNRKNKLTSQIDIIKLLEKYTSDDKFQCKGTAGFSGADILSVVKETIDTAFISGNGSITTKALQNTINETIPLKETIKDEIAKMEDKYKKYNFKSANKLPNNITGR
ncbi:MAG: AAA family ATPase [Clostridiales bacterium]|jgi:SpoVK/Ycf46/Vps4 family AAA+-type ATPase|nr:AAA family ATPase [Clostridiales bacterium]